MVDPLRDQAQGDLIIAALGAGAGFAGAGALGWTSLTAMPTIRDQPQVSAELGPGRGGPEQRLHQHCRGGHARRGSHRGGAEGAAPLSGRPGGHPLRRGSPNWFNLPEEDPPNPQDRAGQPPPPQIGGGSGFIVSPDGYILTNDHVVSGASRLTVTLPDRRQYDAVVVGTDPTTDVAVIRIEDRNLPTLSFGSSEGRSRGRVGPGRGEPGVRRGSVAGLHRDGGDHQRPGPPAEPDPGRTPRQGSDRGPVRHRRLHPDRRGHQPGQLRRAPRERSRAGDRDQLGHRVPDRLLPGVRVRRPHGPGAARHGGPHRVRAGPPAPPRGADGRRGPGGCGVPGASQGRGALVSTTTEGSGAEAAGSPGRRRDRGHRRRAGGPVVPAPDPNRAAHARETGWRSGSTATVASQEVSVRLGEAPLQPVHPSGWRAGSPPPTSVWAPDRHR
jgi:S1-C subfamily serine protease